MPNGTYGGVRGRKTKVGRKLSFSSYSIGTVYKKSEKKNISLFCMNTFYYLAYLHEVIPIFITSSSFRIFTPEGAK